MPLDYQEGVSGPGNRYFIELEDGSNVEAMYQKGPKSFISFPLSLKGPLDIGTIVEVPWGNENRYYQVQRNDIGRVVVGKVETLDPKEIRVTKFDALPLDETAITGRVRLNEARDGKKS